MIPAEKSAAVSTALQQAFGVNTFDDIRPLSKGQTNALVFRIMVKGSPYLLRLIMRTNEDPTRHFTCMNIAAAAGIAPPVYYTSTEDRLAITGFVTEVPFPADIALQKMPAVLRALHALPPFPKLQNPAFNTTAGFLLHKGPALDGLFQKFQAANILPPNQIAELLALHTKLTAAFSLDDEDMVASHNDLFKPDNILYDASQHVWLVDWEAAFLNNRYIDLAVIANLLVTNEAEALTFLENYFGQPPTEHQRAQFFLMRQITHMFYALGYFFIVSMAGQPIDLSAPLPDFTDFHRRLWSGEVTLADQPTKTLFARLHLRQLNGNPR